MSWSSISYSFGWFVLLSALIAIKVSLVAGVLCHVDDIVLLVLCASVLIASDDINIAWMNWQRMFLSIMGKVIPRMTLSSRKKPPWLPAEVEIAMRKRNVLFKKV